MIRKPVAKKLSENPWLKNNRKPVAKKLSENPWLKNYQKTRG